MKVAPVFTRMEVAHEVTTKNRGATQERAITFLNGEQSHQHEGKNFPTEYQEKSLTEGDLWSLVLVYLHLPTYEARVSIQRPDHSQKAGKTH